MRIDWSWLRVAPIWSSASDAAIHQATPEGSGVFSSSRSSRGLEFLTDTGLGGRPLGGVLKRATDILIASVGITALLPAFCVIAILVALTSRGPIVFGHTRVGFNGRAFKCFKFRTMVKNADEVLRAHLASDADAAREWEETFKLRNDPRVTTVGRILRKSSLDELPQLFNVLWGSMSCVGPRPIVKAELARYGSHATDYMAARPGVTGLWQTSGRSNVSYAERVQLDTRYVRNWSLGGDFRILFMTIPAVLSFGETD